MKNTLSVFIFLMISISLSAQKSNEITPYIGVQIETNTFPIGVQFRSQIKNHFWIAPDINVSYGSSERKAIVNMNANLQYVIFFPNAVDFTSFYPLIGIGWNSYKSYKVPGSTRDIGNGSAVLFNVGFGTDLNVTDTQFVRAEFKASFGDHRQNYFNIFLGYGFCF